jgi:hypothetical protein
MARIKSMGSIVGAKIAACDSVASQRVGRFFHDLCGLLKHPRRVAGHCVQCRGDDLFRGDVVDEDQ